MAAVRVAFCWFGVRKTLTPEQKAQAADTFGAEGQYLSADKKLLDTRQAENPNVEGRNPKRRTRNPPSGSSARTRSTSSTAA